MTRMGLVPRTVLVRVLTRVTGKGKERIAELYAACRCGSCHCCIAATGSGGAYIVSSDAGPDVVLRGECCPPEKKATLVRPIDLHGVGPGGDAGQAFVDAFLHGRFLNGRPKSAPRGTDDPVRPRRHGERAFVRPRPEKRQWRRVSSCSVRPGGVQ